MDISDRFRKLPAKIEDPNRQKYSTSGVALIEATADHHIFLVCHDNKQKYDDPADLPSPRFGIVTLNSASNALAYDRLQWPNGNKDLPEDLECLSKLPLPDQSAFIAVESSGRVFYLEMRKSPDTNNYIIGKADLLHGENLKNISWNKIGRTPGMEFEGFSVQELSNEPASSNNLLAVWAHRGDDKTPQGVIFWGTIDKTSKSFSCFDWHELVVDWPRPIVSRVQEQEVVNYARQISGLKILRDGTLLIASALDPGDEGPFKGAVYKAGKFSFSDGTYRFQPFRGLELKKLYSTGKKEGTQGHKIEGFEELTTSPYSLVMVTDDEKLGPSIAVAAYPPED
jgi:hypothetical protein